MNFKTPIAQDHLTQALDTLSSNEKLTLLRRHFKKKIKSGTPLAEDDISLMNQVFQEYAKSTESKNDAYPTGHSTRSQSRNVSVGGLTSLHKSILTSLLTNGAMSRSDLSIHTRIRLQSVCARTNELIALGFVEVIGVKHDSRTQRNVEMLYITTSGDHFLNPPTDEAQVG